MGVVIQGESRARLSCPISPTGSFLLTLEILWLLRLSQIVTKLGFLILLLFGRFCLILFLNLGLCVVVSLQFTFYSRLVSNLQQSFVLGLLSSGIIGISYYDQPHLVKARVFLNTMIFLCMCVCLCMCAGCRVCTHTDTWRSGVLL